ncbi:MAG: RHS repeat-associated core domain-containing protein, partial [Acidobacteria bacterium]|nr:RHS repeat-associated core domain-containing protein [Acidobacteriota bacterium]
MSFQYDAAGRVVSQQLPDNRVISYTYDAAGNLKSLTPPSLPAHGFDYTPVDLMSAYTPPDVGAGANLTTYEYNLDKQPTLITRPDGQNILFGYDGGGRQSTITTPDGQYGYGYDAAGRVSGISAPNGPALTYTYDGSLPLSESWSGAINGSVSRTFNNNLWATSQSVNGGNAVSFNYDNDGLLIGAGGLTLARDSQNGLLTGTAMGILTDSWSYNGFGEPATYSAAVNGSAVFSVTYTRDKLGRITDKSETMNGSTVAYHYDYDAAGRLTDVLLDGVPASQYEYDGNGNRTLTEYSGVSYSGTYDNQDRMLSYGPNTYSYTANGELLTKTTPSGTAGYIYDVPGNLRSVTLPDGTSIDYVIDGQNRRVGKKVTGTPTQGFLYDGQLQIAAELDGSGNVVSRFVYADRSNVPSYMVKSGVTYRIIADHLGSPRLVINTADGTIVQRMDYDEFGNASSDTNPGFQPFGFAGGVYDRHTGLIRFGARDYDPESGRWTAKDPILFDGNDFNLYGYVLNDPNNYLDPFGLFNPSKGVSALGNAVITGWSAASGVGKWAIALGISPAAATGVGALPPLALAAW